jgi:hypothetical protein
MKEPTRADLAAAVARLTGENAALRDLLAAVSLAAGTVPVAKHDDAAEWRRSCRVLANIKGLARLDDWAGYLAYAAGEMRAVAAEPVGYEVYVRPEDDEPAEVSCADPHPQEPAIPCARQEGHEGWHVSAHEESWEQKPPAPELSAARRPERSVTP